LKREKEKRWGSFFHKIVTLHVVSNYFFLLYISRRCSDIFVQWNGLCLDHRFHIKQIWIGYELHNFKIYNIKRIVSQTGIFREVFSIYQREAAKDQRSMSMNLKRRVRTAQCAQCTAAGAIKSSSNNIFTCIFPCVYSYTRTGCIQSIYTSNDPILIFQDGAEENLSCLKIYKRHTHLEINKHWNKCGKKLAGCTF